MLRLRKFLFLLASSFFILWSCESPDSINPDSSSISQNNSVIDDYYNSEGCAECELNNAVMPWGAERGVLLYDSENHTDQGANAKTYRLDGPGEFQPCEDGTAYMSGIISSNDSNDKWVFEVYLSDAMNWEDWSATGRSYVTQGSGIDVGDLFMDWSFYIIDPNQTSTLTGMGDNVGVNYVITHKPSDYSKGIQVGEGANAFNYEMGMLGWFAYANEDGSNPRQGDFILEFNCEPPPPPSNGCTHTIGFWKTHAGLKKQADEVSQYLSITLGNEGGEKSLIVTSNTMAVDVLNMKTYGRNSNGITKLYAQLLAAKLSIADGANNSPVSDVIEDADDFLSNNDWTDWSDLSDAMKSTVLGWKSDLDKYNNGETEVSHCD